MTAQTKHERSIEELHAEIEVIDHELAKLSELDTKARRIVDELSLPAFRGDQKAKKKLDEIEHHRLVAVAKRGHLQSAREGIEGEIQQAIAIVNREATREKAREARKLLATFRQRGREMDTALHKLLDDYAGIASDMATLTSFGVTRINGEMVKANCRRAMRSALIPIRQDLEMTLVPPLERRSFSDLVSAWSGTAEQIIKTILHEPEETTAPAPAVAPAVEQAVGG